MQKTFFSRLLPFFLLPALIFTVCLFVFGVDAPYIDDFHLYNFLYRFDQSGDPRWFLTQTNEHRTTFARLVVWAMERLTGRVNLVWQMGFSVLVLGLLTVLLARAFRTMGLAWTWFAPVPLLLFQLQGWSNYYWGFCAISNVAVLGFVTLSLYLVRKKGWPFFGAIPLGTLATFTMGSGLMVFPAGAVVLLFQRRWRALTLWLIGAGGSAALYLYQYEGSNPTWSVDKVRHAFPNWFTYLGSFADFTDLSSGAFFPLCFAFGVGLVATVAWRLWREEGRNKRWLPRPTLLFLVGLITYVAGTAALVALNRASMIENRYKINAVLFLIATYLLVVPAAKQLPNRSLVWLLPTGAALWFFGYTYLRYLPDVINFRQEALSLLDVQLRGKEPDNPFSQRIQYLQKKGAYALPNAYQHVFGTLNQTPEPPANLSRAFPGLRLLRDSTQISLIDSTQTWSNDPDEGLWLVLQSANARFTWRAARRGSAGAFWGSGRLLLPGAQAVVYAAWLRPGTYRVWVYRSGRGARVVATNLSLEGRAGPVVNWLD